MHFWRLHVCGGRVRKSQAASARVILKSELGQILDQKHQLRSSPKSAKHRLIKGGVSLLLLFSVYSCGQVCVYRRPVCMGDLSLSQMFEAHGSLLSWVRHSSLLIFPETLISRESCTSSVAWFCYMQVPTEFYLPDVGLGSIGPLW